MRPNSLLGHLAVLISIYLASLPPCQAAVAAVPSDRARMVGGDDPNIMGKATEVLAVSADFAEQATTYFSDKSKSKLLTILKEAPYLGVIAGVLAMVTPDSTSVALTNIQNGITAIDDRITSLGHQITDLAKEMKTEFVKTRMTTQINMLETSEHYYEDYLNEVCEAKNVMDQKNAVRVFQSYYNRVSTNSPNLMDSLIALLKTLNGDGMHGEKPYAQTLYDSSNGNLVLLLEMRNYFTSLFATTLSTEALGCMLKNGTYYQEHEASCRAQGDNIIKKYGLTFENICNQYIDKCKDEMASNLRHDVIYLLEENKNKDEVNNKEMADLIHGQISKKYFWQDFTVIVYDEGKDDEKHTAVSAKAITIQNTFGRNTIILFGSKDLPENSKPVKDFEGLFLEKQYWAESKYGTSKYEKPDPTAKKIVDSLTEVGGETCFQAVAIKQGDDYDIGYKLGNNGDFSFGGLFRYKNIYN